jgi:hypothetical protein
MSALEGPSTIHIDNRNFAILDCFLEFFDADVGVFTGLQK